MGKKPKVDCTTCTLHDGTYDIGRCPFYSDGRGYRIRCVKDTGEPDKDPFLRGEGDDT